MDVNEWGRSLRRRRRFEEVCHCEVAWVALDCNVALLGVRFMWFLDDVHHGAEGVGLLTDELRDVGSWVDQDAEAVVVLHHTRTWPLPRIFSGIGAK